MPLLSESYWLDRKTTASKSGNSWLDWCHRRAVAHALARVWPRDAKVVVEVGDGAWLPWFKARKITDLVVVPEPWPMNVQPAVRGDPERLADATLVSLLQPDVVAFIDTFTALDHPCDAFAAAAELAPYVLVVDNLSDPEYWAGVSHRRRIHVAYLEGYAHGCGMQVAASATVDRFHRQLFMRSPASLYPAVALLTTVLDSISAHVLPVPHARHSAVLFSRRQA